MRCFCFFGMMLFFASCSDDSSGKSSTEPTSSDSCDDSNLCTSDFVDPDTGACAYVSVDGECDDGNACTTGDTCSSGTCQAGKDVLVCDDENPCTTDSCDPTDGCASELIASCVCDDGNACTANSFIQENGSCGGGTSVVCDDGDSCTEDRCEISTGCFYSQLAFGSSCDDGNPCTDQDNCSESGECAGKEVNCDDGNVCTQEMGCDTGTGECLYDLLSAISCSDDSKCTMSDACDAGECVSGTPLNCDDGNACTTDTCGPKSGCVFDPNQFFCDDGSACTANDGCEFAQCVGEIVNCNDQNGCTDDGCDITTGCTHKPNNAACDDGDTCTKEDTCVNGECIPKKFTVCDDGKPCTDNICDLAIGGCVYPPNFNQCDDGDPCSTSDTCENGACVGKPTSCDDGNVCTSDSCDQVVGCKNVPTNTPCDDGDPCTIGDQCTLGSCKNGTKLNCDDGNPCTESTTCAGGSCIQGLLTGSACADGNACTTGDACVNGVCVSGGPLNCDDNNACTEDSCDSTTGCKTKPLKDKPCKDGNDCTYAEKCDSQGACVALAVFPCMDDNSCTKEVCLLLPEGTPYACIHPPMDQGTTCEGDGNLCTVEKCNQGGSCLSTVGEPKSCNDSNPCTADSCDPKTGCVTTPIISQCDDSSVCTNGDFCKEGKCIGSTPVNCDDQNPCTTDSCHQTVGCQYQAVAVVKQCDDGSSCTTGDTCVDGVCQGKPTVSCDDGNSCTIDSCNATGGCVFTQVPGIVCDDNDPCTKDVCNVTLDICTNNPSSGAPCVDEDLCTVNDVCNEGQCVGKKMSCDDGDGCTDDSCLSGTCVHTSIAQGSPCDDGIACTTGDTCSAGTCLGTKLSCNDANPCTKDICDPSIGCVNIDNSAQCNDGDPCTLDVCDPKAKTGDPCMFTPDDTIFGCALECFEQGDCDDNNPCTADGCSGGICLHELHDKFEVCGECGTTVDCPPIHDKVSALCVETTMSQIEATCVYTYTSTSSPGVGVVCSVGVLTTTIIEFKLAGVPAALEVNSLLAYYPGFSSGTASFFKKEPTGGKGAQLDHKSIACWCIGQDEFVYSGGNDSVQPFSMFCQ